MKIFHVDMNSFFASCEQAANPEYKGKPLIVCGDPKNRAGIVLAASYEAKAFGVKTTMLKHEAEKLCPNAVFVPSRHKFYSEVSRKVMAILDEFTPIKEQASIDEAYLDMTGTEKLFGDSLNAAKLIQSRIYNELNIGCSIGISTNKLLAKMASDMKKPMGITELYEKDVPEKLWKLPVGELFGVGKKTAEKLEQIGIYTIGNIAATEKEVLYNIFGEAMSKYLYESSRGIGNDKLDPDGTVENQSIGNENTYEHDLTDKDEIKRELMFISDSVGYRLRKEGKKARSVTVKIKYYDFKVITRSKTIPDNIVSTDAIYRIATELFFLNWNGYGVRLLGITVSGFEENDQLSLFGADAKSKQNRVDESVDELRSKFGFNSVVRASIIDKKNKKI